ncbi:AMP-binding protein [Maritimibacter sp. DP1N21-5]|uniref:AMP-binding protein n=1 Tax=Maritimibacter sp. DP1N21-5 TaxID=2836867 RepID=UPI001C46157F|nr:AMP-binding protein [Maritimibacter sp. DP1N21-5]MBV7408536.1 AMP-binding protein [Maritimibacter sp. DP1N21-5]
MNPAHWLDRTARLNPEAPAIFEGTQLVCDYATFARQAASLARALVRDYAIQPGDRVAIFMKNRPEYLVVLYAIWWAGAVAVPINAKLHPQEAAWMLDDCGARVLVGDGDTVIPTLGHVTGSKITGLDVTGTDYRDHLSRTPVSGPVDRCVGDLSWLFYTSGTTGRPKGAMISCGNILAMTQTYLVDVDQVETGEAILYAAPMSHGAGLYNFIHVLRAGRHVLPASGGFDPDEIAQLAPVFGSVSLFAAPTMVRRLVSQAAISGYDGTGLKTVIYGGGPMYTADIEEAVEVLGARFVQIYGQGECPMTITVLPRETVADRTHPRWRERLGSVGVAQSSVSVRVVDEFGAPLSAGHVGGVEVKGAPVMLGYWENPDATKSAIRDGWLATGDRGELDEDGYLTLKDRSRDVIISGGSNIYPREVEEVLLRHPSVSEVSVIGVPDAEWGEIVVAYIVPVAGRIVEQASLDTHCLASLARFKRPKRYIALSELPKNAYGKVLKTTLRARK